MFQCQLPHIPPSSFTVTLCSLLGSPIILYTSAARCITFLHHVLSTIGNTKPIILSWQYCTVYTVQVCMYMLLPQINLESHPDPILKQTQTVLLCHGQVMSSWLPTVQYSMQGYYRCYSAFSMLHIAQHIGSLHPPLPRSEQQFSSSFFSATWPPLSGRWVKAEILNCSNILATVQYLPIHLKFLGIVQQE